MSDRRDFHLGQIVSEAELDVGFSTLELADLALAIDTDQALVDLSTTDGGLREGLVATNPSGFNIDVTEGTGYDDQGRRVSTEGKGQLTVDISTIGVTLPGLGGVPDGGSTDPGGTDERWISLFIVFDRELSDPRIDGNSQTVDFVRNESFHFHVTMSNAGSPPDPAPALESGELLLLDIKRSTGAVTGLDSSRRQDWFVRTGSPQLIRRGQVRAVLDDLLTFYNDHASGTADKHLATDLTYADGSGGWADATGLAATDVGAALDEILDDLADAVFGLDGAGRVGSGILTGAADTGAPATLVASDVSAQLLEIFNLALGRLSLAGGTMAGGLTMGTTQSILPTDATGQDLGAGGTRWDAFLNDLDVAAAGRVKGNLVPFGTESLGLTGSRWDAFLDDLVVTTLASDLTPDGVATRNLGTNALPFLKVSSNEFEYGTNRVISKTGIGYIASKPINKYVHEIGSGEFSNTTPAVDDTLFVGLIVPTGDAVSATRARMSSIIVDFEIIGTGGTVTFRLRGQPVDGASAATTREQTTKTTATREKVEIITTAEDVQLAEHYFLEIQITTIGSIGQVKFFGAVAAFDNIENVARLP